MVKLHPFLVHFPIALIFCAAVFSFLFLGSKKEVFKEVSFWMVIAGFLGICAAAVSGIMEEENLIGITRGQHELIEGHESIGLISAAVMIPIAAWMFIRKKKMKTAEYFVFSLVLLAATGLILYAGYLGGDLVFDHKIGL